MPDGRLLKVRPGPKISGQQLKADFLRLRWRYSAELRERWLGDRYEELVHRLQEIEKQYDLSSYIGQRAGDFGIAMTAWRRDAALMKELLDSPIARYPDRYSTVLEKVPQARERIIALHEEYEELLRALPGTLLGRDIDPMNGMDPAEWHAKARVLTVDLEAGLVQDGREAFTRLLSAFKDPERPYPLPLGPVTRRLSLSELGLPDELDLSPRHAIATIDDVKTSADIQELACCDLLRFSPTGDPIDRDLLTGYTELTPAEREFLLKELAAKMAQRNGREYGGQLSPAEPASILPAGFALVRGRQGHIGKLKGFRHMIHTHCYPDPLADLRSAGDLLGLIETSYSHEYWLEHASANEADEADRPRILRLGRDDSVSEALPSEVVVPRLPDEYGPLIERAHLFGHRLEALAAIAQPLEYLADTEPPDRERVRDVLAKMESWPDRLTTTPIVDEAVRRIDVGERLTSQQRDALARYLNEAETSLHERLNIFVHVLDHPARLSKAETVLDYVDRLIDGDYSSPLIRDAIQQDRVKRRSRHHTRIVAWLVETLVYVADNLPDTPARARMRNLISHEGELHVVLYRRRRGESLDSRQLLLAEWLREALRFAHDWLLTGDLDDRSASRVADPGADTGP